MAQIETSTRSRSRKGRRSRKPLFVDLTPMVDLAFLLITFFMLTTSMRLPNVMELNMPVDKNQQDVPRSRVITFILEAENRIWYCEGDDIDQLTATSYSTFDLGNIIYGKMDELRKSNSKDMICLIKLTDQANYENMIDILDEMEITDVKIYAIQELTEDEQVALDNQLKE